MGTGALSSRLTRLERETSHPPSCGVEVKNVRRRNPSRPAKRYFYFCGISVLHVDGVAGFLSSGMLRCVAIFEGFYCLRLEDSRVLDLSAFVLKSVGF